MRVLVACEFSGIVRDAFAIQGYDAWSCDLLPSEREGNHLQCDVLTVLDQDWDLMIAHPPCTYLTNAGVRHLHEHVTSRNGVRAKVYGSARMAEMEKAADFFNQLLAAPIAKICVENPMPHSYAKAKIGPYSQMIQPWHFGHDESRKTCLWLRGLPGLMSTVFAKERIPRCHLQPQTPDRWKNRSRTLPGIAQAMAQQWHYENSK